MESQSRLSRESWESTGLQQHTESADDLRAETRWKQWVKRTLASVEPAESPEDEENDRNGIVFKPRTKVRRPPDER